MFHREEPNKTGSRIQKKKKKSISFYQDSNTIFFSVHLSLLNSVGKKNNKKSSKFFLHTYTNV